MWMPDWLYAVLPILFAVLAAVVLAVFGLTSQTVLAVGAVFLSGTLSVLLRYQSRLRTDE